MSKLVGLGLLFAGEVVPAGTVLGVPQDNALTWWSIMFALITLALLILLTVAAFVYRAKLKRKNGELAAKIHELAESEKQLILLGDLSHEGIMLHHDGILRSANSRFFSMFGYSQEELIGHNVLPLLLTPESNLILQQITEPHIEQIRELSGVRKGGERFFCIAYIRPLDGEAIHWTAISFRDVSLEKRLARKLRHIQHQVAQINDAIFLIDPVTSLILDANPGACSLLGYSRHELLGSKALDLSGTVGSYAEWKARVALIREYQGYRGEGLIRHKSSEMIPVETSSALIEDEEGETLLSIVRDIRERKQAEAERARMHRELMQTRKMEALGQLTGGVAHDFNNILGIVLGYTELTQSRVLQSGDEVSAGFLQKVMDAAQRARDLVKQMLSFSRGVTADLVVQPLKPLLDEQLKLLRSTLPSSIDLSVHIQEDVPEVAVDASQVYQLLMNLVINARDAMAGVGALRVELDHPSNLRAECSLTHQTVQGDGWVRVAVTDSGQGMSDATKSRIFEPFFTTKGPGKGTGMGLAVVQSIVKGFGGHLVVESNLGKGTSIQVLLPVAAPEDGLYPIEETPKAAVRGSGQHILVVDDEKVLLDYLTELLRGWGYQVTSFSSSESALEHFLQQPEDFDLLLTDQTMPGLLGRQLIDEVRGVREGFPAILHTGYSDSIREDEAAQLAIHYLWKPVNPAVLLEKIADLTAPRQ